LAGRPWFALNGRSKTMGNDTCGPPTKESQQEAAKLWTKKYTQKLAMQPEIAIEIAVVMDRHNEEVAKLKKVVDSMYYRMLVHNEGSCLYEFAFYDDLGQALAVEIYEELSNEVYEELSKPDDEVDDE
jgi:hypothetical protein